MSKISRRNFLATSCLTAAAVASSSSAAKLAAKDAGENSVPAGRFNGTVAIFYIAHFQAVSRDWDSIEEYKGPYHPLLGYYRYKTKDDLLKHLKWLRRAGVDAIVYDIYGFAEWTPMDIEKDRVLTWLMEALADQEKEPRKLKLIIWIERYDSNPSLVEYHHVLNYVRKHGAQKPFYFRLKNKPLVLTYVNNANPYWTSWRRRPMISLCAACKPMTARRTGRTATIGHSRRIASGCRYRPASIRFWRMPISEKEGQATRRFDVEKIRSPRWRVLQKAAPHRPRG